ncbi:MAG: allophanate hydrolase subunit 1 [Fimbriimonadaceae bacterium]
MKIDLLGESALILRELGVPAHELANWINDRRSAGVVEAIASYDTIGVYFDARSFQVGELEQTVAAFEPPELSVPKRHEIPVCYELGDDLIEVAKRLKLSPLEVVHLHCGQTYSCFAVGFCPGFAYLGHLPDALSGLPRRPEPRVRVTPGSVAITGSQTAVYPLERPGGWHIIGRTPLQLVDIVQAYFPITAGDEIAFLPIPLTDFERLEGSRL